MLKSWRVKHFKSIIDATLEPGGVTILTGLNSAGKSSFLESILMIADTLSSPQKDLPLLLPSVSLAETDKDILSDIAIEKLEKTNETDKTNEILSFNFELKLPVKKDENMPVLALQTTSCVSRLVKVTLSFRFEKASHTTKRASEQVAGRPFKGTNPVIQFLKITFPPVSKGDEEITFCLDSVSEQENQDIPSQAFGPDYRLKRPGRFYVNGQPRSDTYLVSDFTHFLPRGLIPVPYLPEQDTGYVEQPESRYLTLLNGAVDQMERLFSQQVHYLGPWRTYASPSEQADHAGESRYDNVGPKGEHAAALYHQRSTEKIPWYDPEKQQIKHSTLEEAVNCWMQYLGLADSVTARESADGISWQVGQRPGGQWRALSAVGNSTRQVLPLLVMGLLAAPGSLLLVEQPELFLHQSVQAGLGDFFVGLTMCDKQSLIETQSENLVAQLRYHIVLEGEDASDKYVFYFADHDDEGFAHFTPIEISPRGAVVNWPEGFFSETLLQEESIRFTYMKKKFEAQQADEHRVVQQGGELVQDERHSG
jgi:predicted ATPase